MQVERAEGREPRGEHGAEPRSSRRLSPGTMGLGGLLALAITACSASPEDLKKGARLVELETQQTKIMGAATSCPQLNKDLDAWRVPHATWGAAVARTAM